MYNSPGLQFLRTTTGIQSGPDVFDELSFIMTFSTIFGVTEILYSFRLNYSERKTDKTGTEIPKSSRLKFLEKFLANNFAFSDAEDSTPRLLNRGGIADLFLLSTLLAI